MKELQPGFESRALLWFVQRARVGVLSAHACDLYNSRARAGLLRACVHVVQGRARTIQGRARTIQGHARTLFGLYSGQLFLKGCLNLDPC